MYSVKPQMVPVGTKMYIIKPEMVPVSTRMIYWVDGGVGWGMCVGVGGGRVLDDVLGGWVCMG